MKKTNLILMSVLTALLLTPFASFAAEGTNSGGGGGVYVCSNPNQSEMLDLFEARMAGLKIVSPNDSVEIQILRAFAKLNPKSVLYRDMMKIYADVRAARVVPVPKDRDLAWPSDATNKYGKKDCAGRAVMIFHDEDNSVDQDTALLGILPRTQQAAAWVHETVYKFLRTFQSDQTSVRTRQIVGHLFAEEPKENFIKAVAQIASFYPVIEKPVLRELPVDGAVDPDVPEGYVSYLASYRGQVLPPLHYSASLIPGSDPRCQSTTDTNTNHFRRVSRVNSRSYLTDRTFEDVPWGVWGSQDYYESPDGPKFSYTEIAQLRGLHSVYRREPFSYVVRSNTAIEQQSLKRDQTYKCPIVVSITDQSGNSISWTISTDVNAINIGIQTLPARDFKTCRPKEGCVL